MKKQRRIICNGTGRNWVWEYTGREGVLLEDGIMGNTLHRILFDNGEEILLYPDEFDFI